MLTASAIIWLLIATTDLTATPPLPSGENYVMSGEWHYANARETERYFPEKAIVNGVDGRVVLDCQINLDGTLKACDVVSETPKGYGFGKSTAAMFLRYAHVNPDTVDGGLRADSRKIFTFSWRS